MMNLARAIAVAAAFGASIGAIQGITSASRVGSAVDGVAIVLVGALAGAAVFAPFGLLILMSRDDRLLRRWAPLAVVTATVVSLGAAIVAAIVAPVADVQGRPGRHNVVLVTVDTLRRDHVGAFGGTIPTPHLDALARDGVVFLDAVSPLPETAPAHASLLTARQPLRHRVLSNGDTLDPTIPTVTEALGREGWATAGFVSSVAVAARTGLDRGFNRYDDDLLPFALGRATPVRLAIRAWMRLGSPARTPWLLERDGRRTTDRAMTWAADHKNGAFFLWVHYFEPHAPYESGREAVAHRARMDHQQTWTDADRVALRAQYADEVTRVDGHVGALVAGLESLGVMPNTTVIVAADHGEMLGEHGIDFTHRDLFDDVVRVPLIIRGPGLPHAEVAAQVRLCDVGATVLEAAGLPAIDGAEGLPLLRYANGERKKSLWTTLVGHRGTSMRDRPEIGLRSEGFKLILPLDGAPEWYDLTADPGERHDLSADPTHAAALIRAKAQIGSDEAALRSAIGASGDPDALLQALGYQK